MKYTKTIFIATLIVTIAIGLPALTFISTARVSADATSTGTSTVDTTVDTTATTTDSTATSDFIPRAADSVAYCTGNPSLNQVLAWQASGLISSRVEVQADGTSPVARGLILNDSPCSIAVSLSSYQMFDQSLNTQKFFSTSDLVVVPSHTSQSVQISIPTCMAQIDLMYGPRDPNFGTGTGTGNGASIQPLAYAFYQNNGRGYADAAGNFCAPVVVTPVCSPNPSTDLVGTLTGGVGVVTNKSTTCSYQVGLASYQMYDHTAAHQTLFDSDVHLIAPGQKLTLNVNVPSCAYQTDLFYGDLITSFDTGLTYNNIASAINPTDSAFCTVPVTPPAFDVACSAAPSPANTGSLVKWKSTITGSSTGTATYSWMGDDGLNSHNFTALITYTTPGIKSAAVNVTIGGVTKTAQCQLAVNTPTTNTNNFNVACSAAPSPANIGDLVKWKSIITGSSTGTATYSWTGDDSLTSTDFTALKTYTSAGIKSAAVNVTIGGVTKVAQCQLSVTTPTTNNNNFDVACSAAPSPANVGDLVKWKSTITGSSTGTATYSWMGDDSLTSTNFTALKTYTTAGIKSAAVNVTIGGVTKTAQCQLAVNTPTTNTNNFDVTCSANPSPALVGGQVKWKATVVASSTAGITYSWVGDNNLSSHDFTAITSYATAGIKSAAVNVTIGGVTKVAQCQLSVNTPGTTGGNSLQAACTPSITSGNPPATVTYSSTVSGGNGSYIYSWTGDNGLTSTSSTATITYNTDGVKNALLSVADTSGVTGSSTCQVSLSTPGGNNGGGGGGGGGGGSSSVSTPTATTSSSTVSVSQSSIPPQVAGVYLTQVPYTGLKENAFAAVLLMTLIGAAGYVAFSYRLKKQEYATTTGITIKAHEVVNPQLVLATELEDYARSLSASVSADAVSAIVAAAGGSRDWAKSVINQVLAAHQSKEWTLVTLESLREVYPHI